MLNIVKRYLKYKCLIFASKVFQRTRLKDTAKQELSLVYGCLVMTVIEHSGSRACEDPVQRYPHKPAALLQTFLSIEPNR